jgi:hypothetical protein
MRERIREREPINISKSWYKDEVNLCFGLALASMLVRALSVQIIPAFATDTVCCSIASWRIVRVWSLQITREERENWNFITGIKSKEDIGEQRMRLDEKKNPNVILSNSSMQHIPRSLSTKAPLSNTACLVSGSCVTPEISIKMGTRNWREREGLKQSRGVYRLLSW